MFECFTEEVSGAVGDDVLYDRYGVYSAARAMTGRYTKHDVGRKSGVLRVSPGMPDFVSDEESVAVALCALAVYKGLFSGPEYAKLLHSAEIRCGVAESVSAALASDVSISLAEVYTDAVSAIESRAGLFGTRFVHSAVELALVSCIIPEVGSMCTVSDLSEGMLTNFNLKSVGDHLVVACASTSPDQTHSEVVRRSSGVPVVPVSVYSKLLGITVDFAGTSGMVSMKRRSDGVFHLCDAFDASHAYHVDSLPAGMCVLPGGYGRLVNTRFMSQLLTAILVIPRIRKMPGYCYLGCLPPSDRVAAAAALGKDPYARDLRFRFPQCMDWSLREADARIVVGDSRGRRWHITSLGCLPLCIDPSDVVGSSSRDDSTERAIEKNLKDMFNQFEQSRSVPVSPPVSSVGTSFSSLNRSVSPFSGGNVDAASVMRTRRHGMLPTHVRSTSVANFGVGPSIAPSAPSSYLSPSVGHVRHRSVSEAGSFSGTNYGNLHVFNPGLPIFQPQWASVDDASLGMLKKRLSSGGYVGLEGLSALRKASEMAIPAYVGDGSSCMLPKVSQPLMNGDEIIPWGTKQVSVPGFHMEAVGVSASERKPKKFSTSHPSAGSLCRYEFSGEGSVLVGNFMSVPLEKTVLWCRDSTTFTFTSNAKIVRVWSDDGLEGMGPMLSTLADMFGASIVRSYQPGVVADRVLGPTLDSRDETMGLALYRGVFKLRGVAENVHFYLFDDVAEQPCLVTISAASLRYVVAHGVRIPAIRNEVKVVMTALHATVRVALDSAGRYSSVEVSICLVDDLKKFSSAVDSAVPEGMQSPLAGNRLIAY